MHYVPIRRLELPLTASLDDELARDLAFAAGQRLLALRVGGYGPESRYSDATSLRKAADLMSHDFLVAELARLRPDDAVLSEEGKDDPARLTASRVWIVDPLDGTREFGELDRADWAVHVALWEKGELAAGAVALPAQGHVLCTPGPMDRATADEPTTSLRILVSRSRPPDFVQRLADQLGAVLVPMGSAGAKAAAVIRGEADAYVHDGGQYEWDSAAPVAVALAAGLHASRVDGSRLLYNQADPSVPDILMSPANLAPTLLAAISEVRPSTVHGRPSPARPSTPSDPEPL
jgi:3'(2'), 5'-bisphosphate nucleotidase